MSHFEVDQEDGGIRRWKKKSIRENRKIKNHIFPYYPIQTLLELSFKIPNSQEGEEKVIFLDQVLFVT